MMERNGPVSRPRAAPSRSGLVIPCRRPDTRLVHPLSSGRNPERVEFLHGRIPMTNQHSFVSDNHCERDLYTSSRTRERALNAAILQAKISESFEENLEIFDAFYGDDIEVTIETAQTPIRAQPHTHALPLTSF